MASDRRKSTKTDVAAERRSNTDRRSRSYSRKDGCDASDFEQVKAPKKLSKPHKTAKSGGKGYFKIFFWCVLCALILGCVIGVLVFTNFEYVVSSLGKTITISVKKVAIDSSELTDKETKTQINFIFKNALPFRVIIQKIVCSLKLSDYSLVENAVFMPYYIVEGQKSLEVPVVCKANSITVRRAIKKGFAKHTASRAKGELSIKKHEITSGNLKEISSITAQAAFKLKLFSFEIPFKKSFKL